MSERDDQRESEAEDCPACGSDDTTGGRCLDCGHDEMRGGE